MKSLGFSLIILAAGALMGLNQPALAADMLTVTGNISVTNRRPYDPFFDAFFKHHDKTFKKAFAFDRAALEKLPQKTVNANAEGWPQAIEAKGPSLKDVLDAAGVKPDALVTIMSLDGYAVEFTPSERQSHGWIVAIEVNGKGLGIGGRGPAWLMYDTGGKAINADKEGKWVWSAFSITAQ